MSAAITFLRQPFRRSAAWMAFSAAAYLLRGRYPALQGITVFLTTAGWILAGQSFAQDLGRLRSLAGRLAAAGIAAGTIAAMIWLRPQLATTAEALALCAAMLSLEAGIASLLVRPAAPPAAADRPPAWLRKDED